MSDRAAYPGISLNKLLNSRIKDVEGRISNEFGAPHFEISRIILEDGSVIFIGGEHDIAYLETIGNVVAGLEPEQLEALDEECVDLGGSF